MRCIDIESLYKYKLSAPAFMQQKGAIVAGLHRFIGTQMGGVCETRRAFVREGAPGECGIQRKLRGLGRQRRYDQRKEPKGVPCLRFGIQRAITKPETAVTGTLAVVGDDLKVWIF